MGKSKMLFYKATKPPEWPFNVVVKRHGNKTIIYVTYGNGRNKGGGAWSENLANVHPRTLTMIADYFDQETVEDIKRLVNKPKSTTRDRKKNSNPRKGNNSNVKAGSTD